MKTFLMLNDNPEIIKTFGFNFDILQIGASPNKPPKLSISSSFFPIAGITLTAVVLLLINFCMDVAVRSIKLAFLQLVAPIPIISYIDPKSGKDGLFKKWYDMCFKTYLSLFIRLLALYFAIYIKSKKSEKKLIIDCLIS